MTLPQSESALGAIAPGAFERHPGPERNTRDLSRLAIRTCPCCNGMGSSGWPDEMLECKNCDATGIVLDYRGCSSPVSIA